MSSYLRQYSAIASVLAAVACSSNDTPPGVDGSADPAPSDSSVQHDREVGTSPEATPDAGSGRDADAASDARLTDATAEPHPDASSDVNAVDVRADVATADVASQVGSDAETRDAQDAAASDSAAEVGQDAGAEASRDASPPDGSVTDGPPLGDAACTPPVHARVTPTSALILNMEGPGLFTQAVPQMLAGNWDQILPFSQTPDAGVHSPWAVTVLSPPRGSSTHGIHSTGSGYPATDANSSGGVGLALLSEWEAPLDSTMYTGVSFWARGSAQTAGLRVFAGLTTVLKSFCLCRDRLPTGGSACNDVPYFDVPITNTWQQYTVRWAQFEQEGWGDPVPTDPKNLLNFVFKSIPPGQAGARSSSWDFWLDDVTFATTP